jgi:Spy/CpxP family protein refolding chaperone
MSAIRTFALAAVAAAALAGSAQAQSTTATPATQPVAGHRGHGRGRGDQRAGFKELNLTDAQKAQIKTIRTKYQAQNRASRDQAMPFIDAARAARQKGDTAAFRSNMEKARQVSTSVRTLEMNEIRAVLTPEQRTKFDAAAAQRKEKFANRGGKGRHGRGGRPGKSGSF